MPESKEKQEEKKSQAMSDTIDEMNRTTSKKDIPAGIQQKQ